MAAEKAAKAVPTTQTAADPVAQLRVELPDVVDAALERMSGADRRLLALRSYLRSARSLEARWSWTDAEIDTYLASDASRMAFEAVDAVITAFEAQNPGYSLRVNTQVRSLDEQIAKWNRNVSVAAGARELEAAFAAWREAHPKAGARQASAFLSGWQPGRPVALAAPGLSPHGRARAFDFQVMKDGDIVAGADTGAIDDDWDEAGWTEKLAKAVKASGMPFAGPLAKPREPWHYEYKGAYGGGAD
jgi:hypothetical protein